MSRKQRYYMRGIGVGILVCALILIISRINTPADISDEEIVSRARALGMVDPGDLSLSTAEDLGTAWEGTDTSGDQTDNADGTDATTDQVGSIDGSGATDDQSGNRTGDSNGTDATTDQTGIADGTGTDAGQIVGGETVPNVESYAVLVVERGNSSDVVAGRLQSLGIIADSRDFDKYLVDNGYASRISVGTFQIPYGSDYDFIARTITRSL